MESQCFYFRQQVTETPNAFEKCYKDFCILFAHDLYTPTLNNITFYNFHVQDT